MKFEKNFNRVLPIRIRNSDPGYIFFFNISQHFAFLAMVMCQNMMLINAAAILKNDLRYLI